MLIVVAHGQLDVLRDDAHLLVVLGDVAGELEHLDHDVLEHRRRVQRSGAAHARRVSSFFKQRASRDTSLSDCISRSSSVCTFAMSICGRSNHFQSTEK